MLVLPFGLDVENFFDVGISKVRHADVVFGVVIPSGVAVDLVVRLVVVVGYEGMRGIRFVPRVDDDRYPLGHLVDDDFALSLGAKHTVEPIETKIHRIAGQSGGPVQIALNDGFHVPEKGLHREFFGSAVVKIEPLDAYRHQLEMQRVVLVLHDEVVVFLVR